MPALPAPPDLATVTLRRWLVGVCVGLGLTACAQLPARESIAAPPATPPTRAALAERIEVEGAAGALDEAARHRTIAALEREGAATLLRHHLAVMSADGPVELVRGNAARLLVDGPQTFAALFDAIGQARQSIWFETYILEDAGLAQRLADLLLRQRARGVAVNVIVDAVGSIGTDEAYFERLRAGGVQVCRFNPVAPTHAPSRWNPLDIAHRDHRKITVVDGRVAFVGGINVSRVYASGSGPGGSGGRDGSRSAEDGWRDTHMSLRGPVALQFERLVRETWTRQHCAGTVPPESAPPPAAGERVVRVLASSPDGRPSEIYRALLAAIAHAQRSVHLTMAYFAPGEDMVEALAQAARRGVEVQLVLPSMSDFAPVLHAGRAHYDRLLAAGVKIAELQDAVLHAKTAVIDGVWSTVGSSNLDWRSFVANDEVNAIVLGEDFGAQMEALFARDLGVSRTIDPAAWARRPLGERLKQWLARMAERWL